jgi:uncharacterized protein YcfJ
MAYFGTNRRAPPFVGDLATSIRSYVKASMALVRPCANVVGTGAVAISKAQIKGSSMRKILLASVALLSLTAAVPTLAQDNAAGAAVGATAGAATGGTIGFFLGGPIGAIIGGFSGAMIGGSVSDAAITYAGNHPVEQVYLDTDLDVGVKVASDVTVYPIEGDADHSYFYANGRVWIVANATGEIIASPGYVVPESAIAYVKANPTTSVTINGDVAPGFVLESDVSVVEVPDARGYAYVYVGDRPALLDSRSRTVIWIE